MCATISKTYLKVEVERRSKCGNDITSKRGNNMTSKREDYPQSDNLDRDSCRRIGVDQTPYINRERTPEDDKDEGALGRLVRQRVRHHYCILKGTQNFLEAIYGMDSSKGSICVRDFVEWNGHSFTGQVSRVQRHCDRRWVFCSNGRIWEENRCGVRFQRTRYFDHDAYQYKG